MCEAERQNAVEPFDLLNCEVLPIISEVDGELINLSQRNRIDTYAERHISLPLPASVDADEPIFESIRIVVGRLIGLRTQLRLFE